MEKKSTPGAVPPGYEHRRVRTRVGKTTRTKQADRHECDINAIMARYRKTGELGHQRDLQAVYGDFTSVTDFHGAQNRIRHAQETFDALPAHIRSHCRNDPAELIKMALDPSRVDEMLELGLLALDPDAEPSAPPSPPEAENPEPPAEAEPET